MRANGPWMGPSREREETYPTKRGKRKSSTQKGLVWGIPLCYIVPWRIKTSNSPKWAVSCSCDLNVHMKFTDPKWVSTMTQDTNSWGFWSVHSKKHLGQFSYITENPGNLKSFRPYQLYLGFCGGPFPFFRVLSHNEIIRRRYHPPENQSHQRLRSPNSGRPRSREIATVQRHRFCVLTHCFFATL